MINNIGLVYGINGSANIDKATSIESANTNQTAQTSESALYKHEHKNITTDVGKIMTDIAINVAVVVGAEVLGPLLESGVSKLGSFVSDSFGLSKAGGELATSAFTKEELSNLALSQGISKSNNVAVRVGSGFGDDAGDLVAGNWMRGPVNTNSTTQKIGDFINEYTDFAYHAQYALDNGTNIGRGAKGIMINDTRPYVINSKYYDDAKMVPIIIKNHYTMPQYNICGANCQDLQRLSELEYNYGNRSLDPILLINSMK